MIPIIKKYIFTRTCLGCVLGAIGGYAYYYFIGCQSGACPLTSNPYISVIYGALIGSILMHKPSKKNSESDTNNVNEKTQ